MYKRPFIVTIGINAHHGMLAVGLSAMAVFVVGGYPWAAYVFPACMWGNFALMMLCLSAMPFANKDDRESLWVSCIGIALPAAVYLSAYLHPSDEMARWM